MPENDKPHPVARETDKDISLKKRVQEEFIEDLIHKTDQDMNARSGHMDKLTNFQARRYQTLGKNPQWPWPGSSGWVSPIMDAEIQKAKAPLMSVFNAEPIVSFVPMSSAAVDKTDAAEQTMQWLLKSRIRDFEDNMEAIADHTKQDGYAIAKITYEYQTRIVSERIRKEELDPAIIQQIGEAASVLETGQVDRAAFEEELTSFIADKFGLDPNDEIDFEAIGDVISFILDGEDSVQIKRREIAHDAPHVSFVDPSLFIPETGVMDLQKAERLTEICFQSSNDLMSLARDGYYDMKAVKRVIELAKKTARNEEEPVGDGSRQFADMLNSQLEQSRADREGLTLTDKQDLFRVHHTYCLYDIDDDGVKEKVLFIYHHGTGEVLRKMEFPYEHGMWPFVQFRNENNDGRFYSPRGIPEQIDQIDELVTENRRGKINSMRISNSPTFKFRVGRNINPNNFKWTPGQFIPVQSLDDFEAISLPSRDFSFDNEEQVLQFWVERVLGSTDLALQSKGGSEARTRAEITAVAGIGQKATSMSVKRWQRYMKQVYEQVWALWMQYGPEEFVISQSMGEIRPLSRHEIQGKFDLQPVGTADEINPDQKFIRSQQRLNLVLSLLQQGLSLDRLLGVEFEFDFKELIIDLFNKDDFAVSKRVIRKRTPEEIQKILAQQAQEQQRAQVESELDANRPVSIAELRQLQKGLPHGGNQEITI